VLTPRPAAAPALLIALLLALLVLPGAGAVAQVPAAADLLPCAGLAGSDDRCEAWVAVHDPEPDAGRPYQFGSDIAVSGDGGLVVAAGYGAQDLGDTDGQADSDWRLLGLDGVTGAVRWLAEPGPSDRYARPLDVQVAADGATVYATGFAATAFGSGDASLLVTAVDAEDGAVRWTTEVAPGAVGGGATDVRGWAVAEVAGDGLVVTGTYGRSGPARSQGLLTVTLDRAHGTLLGVDRLPQPVEGGVAYPVGMAVAPDGATAYVGAVTDGFGLYDLDVLGVAVDLTDLGRPGPRWVSRHDGRGGRAPDRVEGVALDPAGERLFLVSLSGNDVDGPPFDVDYDTEVRALSTADGSTDWVVRDRLAGDALVMPTAIATDGEHVVVAGTHTTPAGTREGVLRRYAAHDGSGGWTAAVTAAGLDRVLLQDLTTTSAGTVVAVGTASSSTVNAVVGSYTPVTDALVVAVDLGSGARTWTARWNATGTGQDGAGAVVAGPDGRAHVLATVTRNVELDRNFYDLAVLAYDP
jgi:hypothetical protein